MKTKKHIKRIFSFILATVLLFSAIPVSFAAKDMIVEDVDAKIVREALSSNTKDYYCKIKLKEGYKKILEPGDTIEVFADYYVGDTKDINISWLVSGNACEYEFVTSKETGLVTGLTITCISGGNFYAFVRIFDSNGNELAKNHIEIWCEAPDNRSLNEKINEFINMLPANLTVLGICFAYIAAIVTVGPVTGFIETCIIIQHRVHELIDFISNLEYCS